MTTVVVEENTTQVTVVDETNLVVQMGLQGPPGSTIEIPFSYTDVIAPKKITTVLTGKAIYEVSLVIMQGLNGSGNIISVGTLALPEELMGIAENDPAAIGIYTTTPCVQYGVNTDIYVFLTEGIGLSQGSGFVVLTVQK